MADISGIRSRLVPAVNIPTPPVGSLHLFFDSGDNVAKLKDSSGALSTVATSNTITGTTLASNVVNSSLTSVGTLVSGTWNANTIGISYGGTGQTTANSALNALLPAQGGNSGKFLTTNGTDTGWASILGDVVYRGTWNANTNSPTLGSSGAGGSKGDYYVVNVAGSTPIDGISIWDVSDWIIHNGTIWEKVDHTDTTTILTGDVTGSGIGSFATTITNNSVTNAKFRQSSALSVVGVAGNSTSNVADITGTSNQVLRVDSAGTSLAFGAINLASTSAVSGDLPATNGGTGHSTFVVGDILYASTTTALSRLAGVAAGNALISGGISTALSWGKIGLTTHVTGVLPIVNGGTNLSAVGSSGTVVYTDGSAYNFTAVGTPGQVLTSQGASAPTWTPAGMGTVSSVDISGGTTGLSATGGPITTSGTFTLAGTLVASNGGTGQSVYAVGDILYASTTTALSRLADVATGNVLLSGGVSTAPAWGQVADAHITAHTSTKVTITAKGQLNTAIVYTDQSNTYGAFNQIFPNSRILVQNPANTFNYTIASSAITAARTLTLPLTTQAETFAVQPVIAQTSPANPTGTTSTTGVMMGIAGAITPVVTGRVVIVISGTLRNTTGDSGAQVQIRTGTGTAPTNGAALTGTTAGRLVKGQIVASNGSTPLIVPFSCNAIVTGLTVGTAIWIDIGVAAITAGTASVTDLSLSVYEL